MDSGPGWQRRTAAPCYRAAAQGAAISYRSATKELSGTPIKSGSGGRQSFPQSSRILRSADFRTVYDNGTRVSGPLFAAFCMARRERDGAGVRIGLTVPKALGGAVVRNRIKRRLRAAFRLHRAEWPLMDLDIVLNPRKAAILAPFADLERAFAEVIRKCRHL
jgi:ribonuclease P protein component